MKKKLFMIFGLPALVLLVVMTGESLIFKRAIVKRQYALLYVAFVGVVAFNELRGPFQEK